MGRWGLRFLFCWIGVFITTVMTACGQLTSPSPEQKTADQTPPIQYFTPPSMASPPQEPVRPAYTLTPLGSLSLNYDVPQNLTTLELEISPPVCYATSVQSYICLGWIYNHSSNFIADLSLILYLLNNSGQPLAIQDISPPLAVLAPGNRIPYRAIITEIPEEDWFPYIAVHHIRLLSDAEIHNRSVMELPVTGLQTTQLVNGNGYLIQGQILNELASREDLIQIIVVLTNQNDEIIGFRIQDLSVSEGPHTDFKITAGTLEPFSEPDEVTIQVRAYLHPAQRDP